MNRLLLIAAALAALTTTSPVSAQQLISDEQVGKTLAQIHCGAKPMAEGIRYLNLMRVPAAKLTNPPAAVQQGYRREAGWRGC